MFEAHPFLALVDITDDVTSEAFGDVAAERNTPAEEPHDVGTAESGHRMLEQAWVEAMQVIGRDEGDIDGPFALVGRPVVRRWMSSEDLVMSRIQHLGNAGQ